MVITAVVCSDVLDKLPTRCTITECYDYIVFLDCLSYLLKVQHGTCYNIWLELHPWVFTSWQVSHSTEDSFYTTSDVGLPISLTCQNLSKFLPILDCLVVRLTVVSCFYFVLQEALSCLFLVINVVKKFKGNMKVQNVIC